PPTLLVRLLLSTTRTPPAENEVREPVWSLSVEDPLPWRRLYSATSEVLTLVWSRKCDACSSASATWRQNSSGFRPRMTLLRRKPATRRSAACRSASRHSPESDRSARPRDVSERRPSLFALIRHILVASRRRSAGLRPRSSATGSRDQ